MKQLLLIVLSFLVKSTFAQTTIPLDSFYTPGTSWTEVVFSSYSACSGCTDRDTFAIVFTIVRDSTIAGKTYHLLSKGSKGSYGIYRGFAETHTTRHVTPASGAPTGDIIAMIRTDTSKVYLTYLDHTYTVVPGICDSFGAEYVLFDFSLGIGSTFPGNYLSSGFTVTSIDTVHLSDGTPVNRYNDQLVYGVGARDGFVDYWRWSVCGPGPGTTQWLLCYDNPRFSYHYQYPPGFLMGNLQNDCFDLSTMVSAVHDIDISPASKTDLYPNPSAGTINLKSNQNIHSVTVYTPSGNNLYTASPVSRTARLDVSHLPKGFYFIRINGYETLNFLKD